MSEDTDLNLGLSIYNNKKVDSSFKSKVYGCDFCSKKFPTCQALGGHQNGHKTERAMMKRRRLGQEQSPVIRYESPPIHHRLGSYQPLSSSNIINTPSAMSRTMIEKFEAYRSNGSKAEEKSGGGGVDLNLKLWF